MIEYQTTLFFPEIIKSCAFSGNRELKEDFSEEKVEKYIDFAIEKGAKNFYIGMAKGFDLICAKLVLEKKKKNSALKTVACIPHEGQEKNYSSEERELYVALLKEMDEVVVLSDHPSKWSYLKRNEYMEKNADMLICYQRKEKGGTKYTISLFEKKKKPILFV